MSTTDISVRPGSIFDFLGQIQLHVSRPEFFVPHDVTEDMRSFILDNIEYRKIVTKTVINQLNFLIVSTIYVVNQDSSSIELK